MSGVLPRFAAGDSVIQAQLDDEEMLLDVRSGVYFGLDGVGARVWASLARGGTVETITGELLAEYDVSRAQLQADISEFLNVLVSQGLAREVAE